MQNHIRNINPKLGLAEWKKMNKERKIKRKKCNKKNTLIQHQMPQLAAHYKTQWNLQKQANTLAILPQMIARLRLWNCPVPSRASPDTLVRRTANNDKYEYFAVSGLAPSAMEAMTFYLLQQLGCGRKQRNHRL